MAAMLRRALSARYAVTGCSRPTSAAVRAFSAYPAPKDGVEWHKFGFTQATRDTKMVITECDAGKGWGPAEAMQYGSLNMEPSATVLNYGQSIFEGMKAYRTVKGRIVLFRPQKNAQRMADGARRMMMPPVPTQLFLEAVSTAVQENAHWVPPVGQGALYLRPLLFGSGADLGVKPSSQYTFVIYVSPVGQYFGPGTTGARMQICKDHSRAATMGVGNVKCAGNYAQCFGPQRDAKADGFSDVIYLDSARGEYIEEAAASNFFCVTEGPSGKVLRTPQLGAILPGITRDSVLQIVRRLSKMDVQLQVGKVTAIEALGASEAFLTGTGAGITPIEHIASTDQSVDFPCPGPVTQMISKILTDIQSEKSDDPFSWLVDPFNMTPHNLDSFQEPNF